MANASSLPRLVPSRPLLLEMLRFGLMGAMSAGIYLLFLVPLTNAIPKRLWLAATIAYLLSMGANYLLQRNFTFKSKRPHQQTILRFIVVQTIGLGLNAAVLEYTASYAHWPMWMAQGAAVFCVAVWSYGAQKIWVFVGQGQHPSFDSSATTPT
jgi:putative flippase GtrA